jgi:hypothetical protein
MAKTKFTKDDIKRAVAGVIDGGAAISTVEIWPDGRILVTAAAIQAANASSPSELRNLI